MIYGNLIGSIGIHLDITNQKIKAAIVFIIIDLRKNLNSVIIADNKVK
jgi:hypothetical protein